MAQLTKIEARALIMNSETSVMPKNVIISDFEVIVLAIVEGPLLIYVGGMMLVLLLIYDIFFKKLLDSQSRAITDSSVQVTKTVNESIQGLKEIKILGKQNFFEDILKENVDIYAKNNIYAVKFMVFRRSM